MTRIIKTSGGVEKRAAQGGIGRALKDRYENLTQEVLPASFAALLALLESNERVPTRLQPNDLLR
jgi:hypothetical protein